MKKKGAGSVGGKGIIFLNLSPGIQRFFRWKER
jgi:hypothetical protein